MKSGFGGPAKPPGAPPAPAGAPPAPPGAAPPAEGSIAFSKVELPGEALFRGEGKEKISDRRQGRSREDDPALSSKQQSAKTLSWIKTLFSGRDNTLTGSQERAGEEKKQIACPGKPGLGLYFCFEGSPEPIVPSGPVVGTRDRYQDARLRWHYFGRRSTTRRQLCRGEAQAHGDIAASRPWAGRRGVEKCSLCAARAWCRIAEEGATAPRALEHHTTPGLA